jgi:hypothetical protein
MSGNIFINYRRGDEPGFVQALLGRLEQAFPADRLFIDVDHIPPGEDFVRVLESQVAECDALLAVIGRGWLDAADESGHRRLDDPNDFVRVEIESALKQGKRVIPVLVHEARMPRADELPEALRPLATRNAVRLTHERFRADVQGLIGALQRPRSEPAAAPPTQYPQAKTQQRRRSSGIVLAAAAAALLLVIAGSVWLGVPYLSSPHPAPAAQAPQPTATAVAPQPSSPPASTTAPAPQAGAAQQSAALPQRPPPSTSATAQCATDVRPGDTERYCASSVLAPEAGNSYSVANLFNTDMTTAWVHGTHKSGLGQWIVVEFDGLRSVKSVTVRNGYQKNAEVYDANSRVQELRLIFSQGESRLFSLADSGGAQTINLDPPVKAYWIQFLVATVYAGRKYPDTAISKLFVTSEPVQ